MSSALATIANRVRERVRLDGVDLAADSALAESYVRDEVRRYSERALGGSVPLLADEAQAAREIVATLTGFGPLQQFFDDPTIEELWINAPDAVFIARDGVSERTNVVLAEGEVRDLVERMLQSSGRRVDLSTPACAFESEEMLIFGSGFKPVLPRAVQSKGQHDGNTGSCIGVWRARENQTRGRR